MLRLKIYRKSAIRSPKSNDILPQLQKPSFDIQDGKANGETSIALKISNFCRQPMLLAGASNRKHYVLQCLVQTQAKPRQPSKLRFYKSPKPDEARFFIFAVANRTFGSNHQLPIYAVMQKKLLDCSLIRLKTGCRERPRL